MIQVEGLHYAYPPILPNGPWQVVLEDLSFEVTPGTCLAITGANNSGKTTLCLAVAGLAPRLTGGRLNGRISVAGRDVQAEPLGSMADVIGLVMQDPTGQLFNETIQEEVAWGLENLGVAPDVMRTRIEWALNVVGLGSIPRDQAPLALSGGQQKRLALAAALALRPQVLILDEPAGGLAPLARAEMIATLRDLRQSLTILLAENDPGVIASLADEVLILDGGRIAARGAPHELYGMLEGQFPPGILAPPASQFAAVVNRLRGLNLTCLTVEQAIEQARLYPLNGHSPAIARSVAKDPPAGSTPAVEIENLTFAYDPAYPVLRGLNVTVPAGQFVALTGDNGAGKTTLAKHLVGLLRPTGGRIRLFGHDTTGQSIGQMARQVGFAFQNPEIQIFSPTVHEEIAFGPRNLGIAGAALETAVQSALHAFGLEDVAGMPPAVLSFSTRRMVALASIAAMNTPIIVLDEPTVGLDSEGQWRVLDWLVTRHREGATVILITHDMEIAARFAERVLVLDHGQILADGAPLEVFSQTGAMKQAGLHPPFAMQFALALGRPFLAADLTPQGAARAWLECLP